MVLITSSLVDIPKSGILIEQITNCTSIELLNNSYVHQKIIVSIGGAHSYLNIKNESLTLDNAIMNYTSPVTDFESIAYKINTIAEASIIPLDNGRDSVQLALNNARSSRTFNRLMSLTSLTKLNMSYNDLDSVPPEIQNLKFLKVLNLNSNNLSSLPPELGNLTALRTLNLQGNNLEVLPNSLGNLTALRTLNLQGNNLEVLPNSLGNLTALRTLNLQENNLEVLPNSLGKLTDLKELNLRRNQLIGLPDEIGNLRFLRTLNLQENLLRTLPRNFVKCPHFNKKTAGIQCQNLTFHMTQEEFNNLLVIPRSKDKVADYRSHYDSAGTSWITVTNADSIRDQHGFYKGYEIFLFCDVRIFAEYLNDYHDQIEFTAASCIQKHCRGILLRNHFGLHNPHCEIGKQYIKRMFDLCAA
jgi:hypothetical protein